MSEMRLRAGESATHRGCSDPTEGTKAIDRDALAGAIEAATSLASHHLSGHTAWSAVPKDALDKLIDAGRTLHATLPEPPKTKMVETYHVEYAVFYHNGWHPRIEICGARSIAEARALKMRDMNVTTVIRITGPHQHEVPA